MRDAAEQLGVSERRVLEYIDEGRLQAKAVSPSGALRAAYAIRSEELGRFERSWGREGDRRRKHWLDKAEAIEHLAAFGHIDRLAKELAVSEDVARAVVAQRIAQRRRRFGRYRGGRPRQRPAGHHLRWQRLFSELRAELELEYQRDVAIGLEPEGKPTQWRVISAVAQRDWAEHPQDWPRTNYPASARDASSLDPGVARAAADRVATALKRLQNAQTETSDA